MAAENAVRLNIDSEDPLANDQEKEITRAEIERKMRKEVENAVEALGPKSRADIEEYRRTGQCAICRRRNPDRLLCRDHRHLSDRFRGLLCTRCNLALGLIRDDPGIAETMAKYLTKDPVLGDANMIDFDEESEKGS